MAETIRYGKIYIEDLATGSGTDVVTLADGSVVSLTKINLTSLTGSGGSTYLEIVEQSSTPSTPSSGNARIYRKTDNKQYLLDDAGTELEFPFTVGTITSGVWNGTAIGVAYGGTNLASYTVGDLLYASGATTLSKLAAVASGQVLTSQGVTTAPAWATPSVTSGGQIFGLTLSNGTDATNDIDIAIGEAISNDALAANRVYMNLTTAITKQLDAAWAVGTNAGGLDTGSIANTTYHIWLIERPDTGVVDALFSTSATAPTMPTNYTKKRRIGSIVRTGGTIVGFIQVGDRFDLKVPINSVDTTNPGTSAVSATLVNVPAAANMEARIGVGLNTGAGGGVSMLFTALDTTDTVPSATLNNARLTASAAGGVELLVRTNSTPAIRYRTDFSDGSVIIRITTIGWNDTRGRMA